MAKNVGPADRILRIALGLALLSLIFFIDGPWRWTGLIGLIALLTAFLGKCPVYSLIGISTCAAKPRQG